MCRDKTSAATPSTAAPRTICIVGACTLRHGPGSASTQKRKRRADGAQAHAHYAVKSHGPHPCRKDSARKNQRGAQPQSELTQNQGAAGAEMERSARSVVFHLETFFNVCEKYGLTIYLILGQ